MRMTSLQWLLEQLDAEIKSIYKEEIETALEIEQEQIEEAFRIGEDNNDSHHYVGRKIHKNGQDYYNKSFKK
jgi:hypothetical protein